MDMITNSAIDEGSDSLEHYGKRGMKWGVWNAETRARYLGMPKRAGKALQKTLSSAKSSVEKGASAVATKAKMKVSKAYSDKKQKREEHALRNKELAEQRKELGMTRAQYNDLREKTLRSHDPSVVERGMRTLTDKELNAKIDRLQREAVISKMASDQATRAHNEHKARSEAIKANPLYGIGKDILYSKIGLKGGKKNKGDKGDNGGNGDNSNNNNNSNKNNNNNNSNKNSPKQSNKNSPKQSNKNSPKQSNKNSPKQSNKNNKSSKKESKYPKSKPAKKVKKNVNVSEYEVNKVNSSSSKSAATRGKRLLTDGTIKAEIISVQTVTPQRRALPPGRD